MQLIIFDCDGTLVDSQHRISDSMKAAFIENGLPYPPIETVRSVIGLSLPDAMQVLVPEASTSFNDALCASYRRAHQKLRLLADEPEPLFEGMADLLKSLSERDDMLLGIATGKSRHGLISVLEHHGFLDIFSTRQTADDAPSKPDPTMIEQALDETGATREETVMIGDSAFDILMAENARVDSIGVSWGYQPAQILKKSGATHIAQSAKDLHHIITTRKTARPE